MGIVWEISVCQRFWYVQEENDVKDKKKRKRLKVSAFEFAKRLVLKRSLKNSNMCRNFAYVEVEEKEQEKSWQRRNS